MQRSPTSRGRRNVAYTLALTFAQNRGTLCGSTTACWVAGEAHIHYANKELIYVSPG